MAKSKGEVATKPNSQVSTEVHDYGEMAGAGFDKQTAQDMAIPFISILQKLSPQCDESNDSYVEGAKAGKLYNTVTHEIYDELLFQPVDTEHCFVEWVPRDSGGGFVDRHPLNSEVVAQAKKLSKQFGKYKAGEGAKEDNDLVETYYLYGHILDPETQEPLSPAMIAFVSTKIKKYKGMNTQMRTVKGEPPLFAFRMKIKTALERRSKGDSYNFDIEFLGGSAKDSMIPPTGEDGKRHPLLSAGLDFFKGIRAGSVKVNLEAERSTSSDADAAEEDDEVF